MNAETIYDRCDRSSCSYWLLKHPSLVCFQCNRWGQNVKFPLLIILGNLGIHLCTDRTVGFVLYDLHWKLIRQGSLNAQV